MPCYNRVLSKGTFWFYQFELNGTLYKSKAEYLTKAEAKREEAKAYQEALHRQKYPTEDISMDQAINERLDYVLARKSKKYYKDTKRYLSLLYHRFNFVGEATKLDIENILTEKSSNGVYTANSALRAFKAFFNQTIQNHSLEIKNPCQYIKPFPVDKRMKYIPTDEEINAVLGICTLEQKMLVEFVRDTGSRINEALNLTGRDVTNVEVILYTRKSAFSNLIPRRVPKPDCLVGQTFPPDKKIFGSWKEQPKFLEKKIKKLNLPKWGWHSLRHRYASLLSAEGKPLFEIMSLLGHSNIETSQKYLQLLPKVG